MRFSLSTRVVLAVLAVLIAVGPVPALQADCLPFRTVKTYWGYRAIDGSPICGTILIGPPPDPSLKVMIGQEAWDCQGNYESWGMTDCDDYTIETYDCDC